MCVRIYISHLICLSFKPTVNVLMYLSMSDFFFNVCRLLFWTKKFRVLILFQWIEMIYFKFKRVDFILGRLKFKCMDVWVNTTCDPTEPMRIVEITYFLRRLFFWFYEKSLICFFENVLISMCLLIGLKIF